MSMSSRLIVSLAVLCTVTFTEARAQQSAALFDAAVVVADHRSRFEALIDFDDDGYEDALDWWWTGSGYDGVWVTGWMNDGTGRLVETWSFTIDFSFSSTPTSSATVGDYNGDGVDDFALAFENKIWLYASNGALEPTLINTLNVGTVWGIDSVVSADFNLDGWDDLAWSDTWTTVLLNQHDGTFAAAEPAWNTTDVYKASLVVGDVNDDGYPDLLNVRLPSLTVWYLVAGQVRGSEGFFLGIDSDEEITPVVGDIDGDLDNDIVAFNPINGLYAVVRDTGAAMTLEAPRVGGPATGFFDIDDDGDLDGVCCGGGCCLTNYNVGQSKFEISINDGTGVFAPAWSIESVGSHHLAGIADLDHDGDWDLVGGRSIYYGNGDYSRPQQRDLTELGFPEAYEGIEQNWLSDPDGDGDVDLRFGLRDVHANQADGSWTERAIVFDGFGVGEPWYGPGSPGDWDGDGDVDLLVTKAGLNGAPREHHVLWNNGSGVLAEGGLCADPGFNMSPAFQVAELDEPSAFVSADIDADGDLDIALLRDTYGGASSRIWLNDGAGYFTHAANLPGRVQYIGQLNGGGLPDIVIEEWFPPEEEYRLKVLYGLGNGTFSNGSWIDLAHATHERLAVIDVDGNGWDDIVAHIDDTTVIAAALNDGAGGWTVDAAFFLPARVGAGGLHRTLLSDVNADGHDDLIVTNAQYAGNASHVFLKKPAAPGFEEPLKIHVSPTSSGDVDGDGDADLFVKLPGADDADGLVLNRRFNVPDDGFIQQYGEGAAGTAGVVPMLGATGPFRVGESPTVMLSGMGEGAIGLLALGLSPSDLPNFPRMGITAYSWPWLTTVLLVAPAGKPGEPNSSHIDISFGVSQDMADIGPIFHQAFWKDTGHPFGVTASAGLTIDYR